MNINALVNIDNVKSVDEVRVSGRLMHEYLEVNSNYTTWFSRMCEYGFEEGKDFFPILEESTGGRPSTDHVMTLDMAKHLAMIQRNTKGMEARQYFIECEKKLKERQQKPKSQLELLVESAQALLEHERKLTAITTKQDEQAKQIEIINKRIDMFNGIDGTNSREELRHKLNAYCDKNGIPQSKGWNVLKQMYNDRYNTNISLLITNYQKVTGMKKRPTMPEYLEATGQLADAHAVLDKLLN